MAVNPNSLKNLEHRKQFVPGDPRRHNGRPRGVLNRKTIFSQWLDFETDCTDPAGNDIQLPLVDKIALAVLHKASKGDVAAVNVVLDNAFGKINNLPEPEQKKVSIDWSRYTEEEVIQLNALMAKGMVDPDKEEENL